MAISAAPGRLPRERFLARGPRYPIHMPSLQATFEAAQQFGLSTDEVWAAMDACLHEAWGDAMASDYLDELTAALAGRILARQRRTPSEPPRIASEQRF